MAVGRQHLPTDGVVAGREIEGGLQQIGLVGRHHGEAFGAVVGAFEGEFRPPGIDAAIVTELEVQVPGGDMAQGGGDAVDQDGVGDGRTGENKGGKQRRRGKACHVWGLAPRWMRGQVLAPGQWGFKLPACWALQSAINASHC